MTRSEVRLWLSFARLAVPVSVSGFLAFQRWQRRRLEARGQSWPAVDGRLHGGRVDVCGPRDSCVVTFSYDYYVDEYRAGTYTQTLPSEAAASDFVDAVKDKKVVIHYNPTNPDESVLEPDGLPAYTLAGSSIG